MDKQDWIDKAKTLRAEMKKRKPILTMTIVMEILGYKSKASANYTLEKLQEMGLLETKLKKVNGAPTVHYKFLFDEFEKSIVKFLHNGKSRNFTIYYRDYYRDYYREWQFSKKF